MSATWHTHTPHRLTTEERNSNVDPKIPNAIEVKEELEESVIRQMSDPKEAPEPPLRTEHIVLWVFQDEEQFLVKQETNSFNVTHSYGEIIHNEPELQYMMETKKEAESVQIEEKLESEKIKDEHEDFCSNQREDQLVVKQEIDNCVVNLTYEKNDMGEPEPNNDPPLSANSPEVENQNPQRRNEKDSRSKGDKELFQLSINLGQEQEYLCSNQEQLVVKQETENCGVTRTFEENNNSEPERDKNQLLSANCPDIDNQHQSESNQKDSDARSDKDLQPERRHQDTRNHWDNVENSKLTTHKIDQSCCEICGKCFRTQNDFSVHMRNHRGEKLYPCEVCGKSFSHPSNLKTHKITHTEKPYSCELCGKSFQHMRSLTRHLKTHTDKNPYSCPLCEKSFQHNHDLSRHYRIHTDEKPYYCKFCGKSFRQSNVLNRHIKTHTDDKPYCCPLCEKSFRQNHDLSRHFRIHTGEKPYSCKLCGKSFRQRNVLNFHLRTHTGEKPYTCKFCNKSYRQNSYFKRHLIIHTGEKPYS